MAVQNRGLRPRVHVLSFLQDPFTLDSRGYYFLIDTDDSWWSRVNKARSAERKKYLWSQELRVSFPCNFRIIYLIKPVWSWCAWFFSLTLAVEIWSYVTLRLRCMKKELRENLLGKESAIKNCHKLFSKKIHKHIERTEVSCEVHTLCMFLEVKAQQDKKNFRSATLVLLYQVKLNIARQNSYAKQKIILLHFLANKSPRELSEIRKKKKNLFHPGYYPWECRTEPSKTKHSRKSSHSFKVRPW